MVFTALLLATAEVTGGVRLEVQAGQAPTIVSPEPVSYAAALVRPELALRFVTPSTETFVLETPRLLVQRPNVAHIDRPLFLNTARVEHRGHRGLRHTWELQLTSTAGEVDYLTLAQTLGPQAALPSTLKLFTLDGSAQLAWRVTRQWTWVTVVGALRRQPFGSQPTSQPVGAITLPTETDVRLEPRLEYAATARSMLLLRSRLAAYRLVGSVRLQAFEGELRLGWRHRLTRYTNLELSAGAAVASAQERSTTDRPWTSVSPVGEVGVRSATPLSRTSVLRARANAGVDWYLDPVLGTALPRAELNVDIVFDLDRTWLLEAYVLAATNVSRQPLVGLPIETLVSAGIPLRYRISRHFLLDFGGRYSERGPHLRAPGFALRQRELLGFLALTATTQ